jgi:hypothetical protein
VWLNQELVHEIERDRPYVAREDIVPVQLQGGRNVLVLRVDQEGGGWGFGAHVESRDGAALPALKVVLD